MVRQHNPVLYLTAHQRSTTINNVSHPLRRFEVLWDSTTVWVNDQKGSNIGRFGRFGADVHRPASEQDTLGQCLDCHHNAGIDGWKRFCASMLKHYGVIIPDAAMPVRLQPRLADEDTTRNVPQETLR